MHSHGVVHVQIFHEHVGGPRHLDVRHVPPVDEAELVALRDVEERRVRAQRDDAVVGQLASVAASEFDGTEAPAHVGHLGLLPFQVLSHSRNELGDELVLFFSGGKKIGRDSWGREKKKAEFFCLFSDRGGG